MSRGVLDCADNGLREREQAIHYVTTWWMLTYCRQLPADAMEPSHRVF